MSSTFAETLAELVLAVHADWPAHKAVRVSRDAFDAHARWLPRGYIASMHLTGRTLPGTDRDGSRVTLPMAHLTLPAWVAKKRGLMG